MNGLEKLDREDLLIWDTSDTTGHRKKLRKDNCRRDTKKFSFSQRCVEAQSSSENSLPTDGESDAELFPGTKRLVKRKHRASELQRNQANHRQCSPKPRSRHNSVNNRRHKGEAR
ncbi:hypothetical protein E2C01_027763 [Portunus trituberculatus]|uniref:Uncharacterized protein n=1 Tax=Portunus trituberculatus TaxID=210409 RepID=A0A5B7EM23_PORTR|nr:hypothetical protein [Portunus trituberculatus]